MTNRESHPRPACRRRRSFTILAATVTATIALGYGAFAALTPVAAITPVVVPVPTVTTPAPQVDLPDYGAWAIGSGQGDQLYAGRDVDTALPIASIAKVVTALVVLDAFPIAAGEPGATLTLTAADSRLPGVYAAMNGTVAPAPAGQTVTQRQVIELMMVHSANNYAETLAVWAFGSVDAYLTAARSWLDERDIVDLTIADTTGFSPGNAGTARALVQLAQHAAADPTIAAAAALPSVSIPGIGTFENRNAALGIAGVTGLKTGTLRVIGSNLLFSATITTADDTVDVVGVAIGAPDQPTIARDLETLITSVTDDFHRVRIGEEGAVVARYDAPWGDSAELRIAETVDDLVWGEVRSVAFTTSPTLQPGLDSAPAPTLTVQYGDRQVRLMLEWVGSIEPPPLDWQLAQPLEALFAG